MIKDRFLDLKGQFGENVGDQLALCQLQPSIG
jgi:hypothetical protein